MQISVLKQKLDSLGRKDNKEAAFGIAEALIASVIIMLILVATAGGMTGAFRSSSGVENSNKAIQYANEIIAISKQAPYRSLWVPTQSTAGADAALFNSSSVEEGKCVPQTTVPASSTRVTNGESTFPGLVYCQAKKFGSGAGVGTTFYVQTQIVFLTSETAYDRTPGGYIDTGGSYYAKRVFVTVRWKDVLTGGNTWSTYKTSYTKSPTVSDCIPDRVVGSAPVGVTIPPGCTP